MTYRALIVAVAATVLLPACSSCNAPPVKERLKSEPEECAKDTECDTGLCFALKGQPSKCGRKCSAGCKADEVCSQLDLSRFGCVPKREGLCKPCASDADCPYPADRCIVLAGMKMCGQDCSFDSNCPESYTCATAVAASGGDALAQCQPKSGTCECTAISVGQRLTCEKTSDAGTCVGTRTCELPGYTDCSAKQPTAEVCNLIDDDCNVQIDENLGDTACGVGECLRTVSNCVNGQSQICVPGMPTAEICDNKDNDCDGTADDGIDKNSLMFCGTCTNSCTVANGTAKCTTGTCGVDTCTAPFKDCDGVYSNGCEANTDTSLSHCGMCMKPCAAANATPTCGSGACTFVCLSGFGDLDKNPANGCEATCVATDAPELGFIDTNCDGIDGIEANAIFVDALGGADGNAGTKAMPKATIGAGIVAAAAASPKKAVYVSKGIYGEAITLSNGVSVYGGYDASAAWARSTGNFTIILSPGSTGVVANGLSSATTVQLFTISATTASGNEANGAGRSSTGVLIVGSGGGVTLSALTITAGNGSAGAPGADGQAVSQAGQGGNASGTSQGGGGSSACGATGGAGGNGVGCTGPGQSGSIGTAVGGGGLAAAGGNPGAAGNCSLTSSGNGGAAPVLSQNGGPGSPGSGGVPNSSIGALDAAGLYLPPAGGAGTGGTVGGPGGGGGSGGGTASGTSFFCDNCSCLSSGGGGGGGGGGCGGLAGLGGPGGGGSFGVVALNSLVTIEGTKLTTGNGGKGGDGGDGSNGGLGGLPGSGTAGASRSNSCSTRNAGAGANGSSGGQGGRGGGGAGGTGGPSICVYYKGIAPTTTGLQCVQGTPGQGGAGGQGFAQAQPGPGGVGGVVVTSN